MVAAHIAPGRVGVAGLGHDLEARLRVEQHPQAAADHRVVVGDHDPNALDARLLGRQWYFRLCSLGSHDEKAPGPWRRRPGADYEDGCGFLLIRRTHTLRSVNAEQPTTVVIAGGGVAAIEAALALSDLAADRLSLQLVASKREFTYRPLSVREPFAYAPARRYPLSEVAAETDAELIADELAWVDPDRATLHTAAGAELPYDGLVVALGARMRPAFEHAVTIDDHRMDELLHGLIQDVEEGYVHSLAFVAPGRLAWPLPIYELALMTARRAYDSNEQVKITIVTPEDAPLAIFGAQASQAVSDLLRGAGIEVLTSAYAEVPRTGHVVVHPGQREVDADRVVALPELYGPAVRGLPAAENGFIPVDPHGHVRGVERVYACGDATDFAIKHGGLAAQQADAVAESIAASVGADLTPKPFDPEIRGILLTGEKPRYLTARITGGHGFSTEMTAEPTWSPAGKISATYLTPYLERQDRAVGREAEG